MKEIIMGENLKMKHRGTKNMNGYNQTHDNSRVKPSICCAGTRRTFCSWDNKNYCKASD